MKIYKLTKWNRFRNTEVEVFYASREKAEQEKAEIITTYENAVAEGNGVHWSKVIWNKDVFIEEIEVIE
jgi:hypothetical protein